MKCILLAAGYATRLYPLTENFPKPLLKVGEKSILDWLTDDVAGTGLIDEYVIVSNHKFAAHFEAWAAEKPLNVRVVDDGTETNETRLGAVRDLLLAFETLPEPDDLLVMAGDNVLDFSLAAFLRFCTEKRTSCVMCYPEPDEARRPKTAILAKDANGRITSFEEKPKEPKGTFAAPPFYYYKKEDAQRLREALADGCGYDAPGSFAAWLSAHSPMHAYEMPGRRYDIGNLESYRAVQALFGGAAAETGN